MFFKSRIAMVWLFQFLFQFQFDCYQVEQTLIILPHSSSCSSSSSSSSSSSKQDHVSASKINFIFSIAQQCSHFIDSHSSTERFFMKTDTLPTVEKTLSTDHESLMNDPLITWELMELLGQTSMFLSQLVELVTYAVNRAQKDISVSNGDHDVWDFHFSFTLAHKYVYYDRVLSTVPATDRSIESLERRKMDSSEMCSICLEDLEEGCVGFGMPCSHAFHQDCITKWLRVSHYCPLCRYQLPEALHIGRV